MKDVKVSVDGTQRACVQGCDEPACSPAAKTPCVPGVPSHRTASCEPAARDLARDLAHSATYKMCTPDLVLPAGATPPPPDALGTSGFLAALSGEPDIVTPPSLPDKHSAPRDVYSAAGSPAADGACLRLPQERTTPPHLPAAQACARLTAALSACTVSLEERRASPAPAARLSPARLPHQPGGSYAAASNLDGGQKGAQQGAHAGDGADVPRGVLDGSHNDASGAAEQPASVSAERLFERRV
eukprot:jgi/Ulvmu1/12279/UM087_0013.1